MFRAGRWLGRSHSLACGIDLAMHGIYRYFGRRMAEDTAYNLEYGFASCART